MVHSYLLKDPTPDPPRMKGGQKVRNPHTNNILSARYLKLFIF
jgi:hypothetical protein